MIPKAATTAAKKVRQVSAPLQKDAPYLDISIINNNRNNNNKNNINSYSMVKRTPPMGAPKAAATPAAAPPAIKSRFS